MRSLNSSDWVREKLLEILQDDHAIATIVPSYKSLIGNDLGYVGYPCTPSERAEAGCRQNDLATTTGDVAYILALQHRQGLALQLVTHRQFGGTQTAVGFQWIIDNPERGNTRWKPQEKLGVLPATMLMGKSVINRQHEKLGKLNGLMIDASTGHLTYVVLSFNGSRYAVPWRAFEFADSEKKLILDVDGDRLKAAPGFDKDEAGPDFADRSWGGKIHEYYGSDPHRGE